MFQGASQISLDAKGRLTVPTRHRDGLAAPSSGRLVLTGHPHRCLLLYPEANWLPIRDSALKLNAMNPATAAWKRMLIGFAEDHALDATGRILISPELRAFAGIEKQAMFVGQGAYFEIWSLNAWNEQLGLVTSGAAGLPPGDQTFSL